MVRARTPILLVAFAILLVAPAEATTSYYTGASGETTFNGAVAGLTLLDPGLVFSAGDLGSGGLYNASGTGINFLGFDDFLYPTIPDDFTVNSGQLTATQPAQHVTIQFPAGGVYAFGIHITMTSGSNANWCVELTQGACDYTVFNSTPSSVQFFGFVSDTPVTAPLYIHAVTGSATIVITNFEAFSNPVPEGNTMLLVGLGLVILPLARWRIRRGV
jgi:hypothetical protein